MKTASRIFCILFLISCILTPQIYAHQRKDHKKLGQIMQRANDLLGEISYTLKKNDYFAAAAGLMGLAKIFKSLETITPAKGSKNEWDMIHEDLINAAFKAIGACGEEDGETVRLYMQQISGFMKEGHSIFR